MQLISATFYGSLISNYIVSSMWFLNQTILHHQLHATENFFVLQAQLEPRFMSWLSSILHQGQTMKEKRKEKEQKQKIKIKITWRMYYHMHFQSHWCLK